VRKVRGPHVATAAALAGFAFGASLAFGCSSFGGADADDSPTNGDAAPPLDDAGTQPDGAPPDGVAVDGPPACAAACEGGCSDAGVCAPFEFATGLHVKPNELTNPIAITVDGNAVYVADYADPSGPDMSGGIWRAPVPKVPGTTTVASRILARSGVASIAVKEPRVYFAREPGANPNGIGFVEPSGNDLDYVEEPTQFVAASTAWLVAARGVGTANVRRCTTNDAGTPTCVTMLHDDSGVLTSVSAVDVAGSDVCFAGSVNGEAGIYCRTGPLDMPYHRVAVDDLTRVAVVRGGRAYWISGDFIRSALAASSNGANVPVHTPGATTLAVDDTFVYYSTGSDLFAFPRNAPPAPSPTPKLIARAPRNIRALAVNNSEYVYLVYGSGPDGRIARVRRP